MPRTHRKKKPLWTPQELRKEEVRGIFTIGVLSLLLAVRFGYGESTLTNFLGITITTSNATDFLLPLWGAYILMICVALSDDLFVNSRVRFMLEKIKDFAGAMFVMGVLILLVVGFIILLPVIFVLLVITLGSAPFFYLHYRLKRRRRRSKK